MENSGIIPSLSNSTEDVSEYADAEENISAPTELLAEFLHSVMAKNYEKALQYCTQILSYEPNNATVREFHPLIEEKLEMLRKEELESSSSDSSSTLSSSTSGSLDNLHNIKSETYWGTASINCSSLESDDNSNESPGTYNTNLSQSDITNGNMRTGYSFPLRDDSIKTSNFKEIKASVTKTLINPKLLTHQTQTRILRCDNAEDDQNNDISNLHSTNTRMLTKENLTQNKDFNSRTIAWFSSLQENIFGSRKEENRKSSIIQNSRNSNTNGKEKKTQ